METNFSFIRAVWQEKEQKFDSVSVQMEGFVVS